MRPASIVQFERILLAALAIDLVNNLFAWPALAKTLEVVDLVPSPVRMILACTAAPLIGLLLWYLIARRASVVAKWILVAFVALGAAIFVYTAAHLTLFRPMFIVAIFAEVLKIVAVSRLFTADAAAWFSGRAAR